MGAADRIASFRARSIADDEPVIVAHVHRFWSTAKGDRWAPAWRDIDLMTLTAPLIPYILVCDVTDDGEYRYRYWGRAHSEHHGIDYTGKTLSAFEDRWSVVCLRDQYEQLIAARTPMVFEMTYQLTEEVIHAYRAPLSEDGENVTAILSLVERRYMPSIPSLDDEET